jgi:acetyltransferase-like isoleucine patch superfamily enzyme
MPLISKGECSYDAGITILWDEADLIIGKYTSIGKGLEVYLGGNHRVDWISTYPITPYEENHKVTKGNVVIGNNVWIGNDVTLMSGITIGDGSVIGAKSVVGKDVMAYSLVVGNPATFVKWRFPEEQVKQLIGIEWWDWPQEKIEEVRFLLLSDRIEEFILYAKDKT